MKIVDLCNKIILNKWFILLMEVSFFINLTKKDIWGSLITLYTISIIAIIKVDKHD